jgi:Zn-dependent peptidase ImmA (M78 family)
MRLPDYIDLFLAKIKVELISHAQMRLEAECEEDHRTPEGLWDTDNETIFIGKWLRSHRKREVLMHELAHACLDWRDEGKCE